MLLVVGKVCITFVYASSYRGRTVYSHKQCLLSITRSGTKSAALHAAVWHTIARVRQLDVLADIVCLSHRDSTVETLNTRFSWRSERLSQGEFVVHELAGCSGQCVCGARESRVRRAVMRTVRLPFAPWSSLLPLAIALSWAVPYDKQVWNFRMCSHTFQALRSAFDCVI